MIIYSIKNTNNGKEYIGQTIESPNAHWSKYKYNLRKNRFHNEYLQNSWNKYGENCFKFEVIDVSATTIGQLNILEIKYIKERGNYNILIGGDNKSAENRKLISRKTKLAMTDDVCKRISESRKGQIPWNVGLSYDAPWLRGDNNPAKRESVRKKMSENHADVSGENNPNAKLKQDDINKIRLLRNDGLIYQKIANKFGISKTHARRLCI